MIPSTPAAVAGIGVRQARNSRSCPADMCQMSAPATPTPPAKDSASASQMMSALLWLHALRPDLQSSAAEYRMLFDSGLLQKKKRPTQCRASKAMMPGFQKATSDAEHAAMIGGVFDAVDRHGRGRIGKPEVIQALKLVDEGLRQSGSAALDLTGDDVQRLAALLVVGDRGGTVGREAFIESLMDLLQSLDGLGGLTLRQLQDLICHSFEELDLNGDGRIAVEEFTCAAANSGLDLSPAALRRLHSFLDLNKDGYIDSPIDTQSWKGDSALELWSGAFQVAMQAQYKRKGLDKAFLLFETWQRAAKDVKNPLDLAFRAFSTFTDFAELLVDYVELSIDLTAVFLALSSAYRELAEAKSLAELDVQDFTSFLVLLGISGLRMTDELAPVCDLSWTEAFLFVKIFQPHGFSVQEFRQLRSTGPEVISLPKDASLDSLLEGRLLLISKGSCRITEAGGQENVLKPGDIIGGVEFLTGQSFWESGELFANSELTLVCFDIASLKKSLERHESLEAKMSSVLSESTQKGRTLASAAREVQASVKTAHRTVSESQAFEAAFDMADTDGNGAISVAELEDILHQLHGQDRLSLMPTAEMAQRMISTLSGNNSGTVSRTDFVEGMVQLEEAQKALDGLSINQLKDILQMALERFDENSDGKISPTEFGAALSMLGFDMSVAAVGRLHALLDADGDGFIGDLSTPDIGIGRMVGAFQAAMQEQYKRKVESKVSSIADTFERRGPQTQMNGSLANSAKDMEDLLDAGLDATAFCTAAAGIYREVSGLENWVDLDMTKLGPFLVFLGLSGVYMARELSTQEVTDMTEDEALLYARDFRSNGFSLGEFRRLLRHGAQWKNVPVGQQLNIEGQLAFIVRGAVQVNGVMRNRGPLGESGFLRPGEAGAIQAEMFTDTEVRLVTWDLDELQKYLELAKPCGRQLRSLLESAAAAKARST